MDVRNLNYQDSPSTLFINRPAPLPRVLVLIPAPDLATAIAAYLQTLDIPVTIAADWETAPTTDCELILMDIALSGSAPTALPSATLCWLLFGEVAAITAWSVQARLPWWDILPLPFDSQVVLQRLGNALRYVQARLDLQRFQQRLQHLRRLTRIAKIGYWGWEQPGRQWQWGAGLKEAINLTAEQLGQDYASFLGKLSNADRQWAYEHFEACARQGGSAVIECDIDIAEGQRRHLRFSMETQLDAAGQPQLVYGTVQDITDHKNVQALLKRQAQHDVLTGLPNKTFFMQRLEQALLRAEEKQTMVGLLLIDLDRFKIVNQHLSHAAGDRLLVMVGQRLQTSVREQDTVARILGDEFGVILEGIKQVDAISSAVRRLEQQMMQPFLLEGEEFFISMSIGIAIYPADATDSHSLLRGAEHAVGGAKRRGGRRAEFFTDKYKALIKDRVGLEAALHKALDKGEIEIFYQPQLHCQDLRIVGFEALVRWRHSKLGLITPDRFIPIAEETGLINQLGHFVMQTAMQQLRQWQQSGYPDLRMGINLSARQFLQEGLLQQIAQVIEKSQLAPAQVDLEITESIAMQSAADSAALLQQLKSLGVRLSMDDFGTGYSSLNYLQQFPFDTIKIDRIFVSDITPKSRGEIAKTVIAMTKSLGKNVLAEGVETEYQLEFLRDQGCDEIQGYLIAKPLTAEQGAQFLATYKNQTNSH